MLVIGTSTASRILRSDGTAQATLDSDWIAVRAGGILQAEYNLATTGTNQ
jgi:hypothetical protein